MSPVILEIVLAGFNVDRSLREAISGDLIEERAELAALRGERRADRWMRLQILRSAGAFAQAAVCNGGLRLLGAIVGAALTALLAVSLLVGASTVLLSALVSPETIARLTILAFLIDLAYGAAGGYLAARLGRAAPLAAAFVFGVFGVALTLLGGGDVYAYALQLLLIPATVTGGWVRARQLVERAPTQ